MPATSKTYNLIDRYHAVNANDPSDVIHFGEMSADAWYDRMDELGVNVVDARK